MNLYPDYPNFESGLAPTSFDTGLSPFDTMSDPMTAWQVDQEIMNDPTQGQNFLASNRDSTVMPGDVNPMNDDYEMFTWYGLPTSAPAFYEEQQ